MSGSTQAPPPARRPGVVVLSSLFPSALQPQAGLFIRERMFRVGAHLPLAVVSPQPWFPLQSLLRHFRPGTRLGAPAYARQDGFDVWAPRFLSAPLLLRRLDGESMALGAWPRLRTLRQSGRLDVLDAHFGYPDGYAGMRLKRRLGVPLTITMRGTEVRHARDPVLRPLLAQALHAADRVFAVSESLRQVALELGVAPERTRVIGNGVDLTRFSPLPRDECRAALGLAADAPVIVTVGGLVERKGFHRVIECLPRLLERHPRLTYLVIGGPSAEGDWTQRLKLQVAELGLADRVRFLGPVAPADLARHLSAADVFVLATRNEGWANVFLEAMACGLPVVTTDVGGNAEVVSHPDLGSVVPFGDPGRLHDAIDEALLRRWDRARIRGHAEQNTWDRRVEVLVEEFGALAGSGSRTGPAAVQQAPRGAYTRFVSGVIFPLHERLKRHDSVARRRELERTQWLEPEALEALRVQRLRRFLGDVGRSVPYYQRLFAEHRFDPAGVRSLADLQALPLLGKAEIRAHGDALKRPGAARLVRYNTGGSSGEPLVFHMGMDRVSHDVAAKWRATRWWGVDIGDPEIVIWGSPVELGAQDRMRQWRDRLLRSTLLPAFEMSEENLDRFVAQIRHVRPAMLFGYPSALALIGEHAARRGVALGDLGIRVAFVTSERLYDHQRAAIERAYGCPVANGYGGRDAGFIAHQCPHGGMHVTAEDIVVELLDRDGRPVPDGQPGEIVTTHMASGDFPFIRYRTGDMGVMATKRCECGRGLPMLQEIQGRSTDFVIAADGTMMHGLALIYILRDMPGLAAFKIVQQSRRATTVYLVPGPGLDRGAAQVAIVQGFRKRLGIDVDVTLEWVEQIPPERSGKFRYVVSHAVAA